MLTPNLINHNLFAIPVPRQLQKFEPDVYILYSPIAKKAFLTNEKKISLFENWLGNHEEESQYPDPILQKALDYTPIDQKLDIAYTPDKIHKLSVLPTHACNLSCSYCYSALGRSKTTLSKEKLASALEYFIDRQRIDRKDLHLSVIGGGEPLIQWPLVKYCFEHAEKLAVEQDFTLNKTLITNGTILNNEITDFLIAYNILPNISFEILETHQNSQRGRFNAIVENIKTLLSAGLQPTFNATITPSNVNDLEKMVETVFNEYHGVNNLIFEPVVDLSYFATPKEFDRFHKQFTMNFYSARKLALINGIELHCKAFMNMSNLTKHGCETRFSLTPDGDITNCYCVSSPKEALFKKRVIGKVNTDKQIEFNMVNYNNIMSLEVDKREDCSACFLKYNCGGGCMLATEVYTEAYFNTLCNNVREFSIHALIEKYKLDTIETTT